MKKASKKIALILFPVTSVFGQPSLDSTVIMGYLLGDVTVSQTIAAMTKTGEFEQEPISQATELHLTTATTERRLSIRSARVGHPNSILLTFFDSERALIAALITGQVDYAILENDNSVAEVHRSSPDIKVPWSYLPDFTVKMLCYNCSSPFFSNRSIRAALSYAINKKDMVAQLLEGKADLIDGPLSRESALHPSGMSNFEYDPKQALQLFSKQGWRDTDGDHIVDKDGMPFQFSLIFPRGVLINDAIVRWIKINLNEIGVDIQALPLDRESMDERLKRGRFDAVLHQHQFREGMDSLENFFSEDSEQSFLRWSTPTFRRYVNIYRTSSSTDQRLLMFQAVQKLINREQPVSFLYAKWIRYHLINSKKFTDFLNADGSIKPIDKWRLVKRP